LAANHLLLAMMKLKELQNVAVAAVVVERELKNEAAFVAT
jgi:hypothetical protein